MSWPDHLLTLEEWDALPEIESHHVELVEGVLVAAHADAGIPHYWLLELDDPITVTAFDLVDGSYKVVAGGTGKVEVPSPFPVVLDLPALLTR
ncbi:hypothetical protein ACQPW3_32055 [Actinosynnema sp. CA-248983]